MSSHSLSKSRKKREKKIYASDADSIMEDSGKRLIEATIRGIVEDSNKSVHD
jgi:hypothetical protein